MPGRRLRSAREGQVVFWIVYLGALVAAWQVVPRPYLTLTVIGIALVPIVWRRLHVQRVAQFNNTNKLMLETLQRNPERAAREFEQLADRYRRPAGLHRLAGYNRALALLRIGRLDEAVDVLDAIDRAGGVINLDSAIAGTLAYLHALCGNLAPAEAWLVEAKRRSPTSPSKFPHLLSEIAIDLRAGKAREVATQLEEDWAGIEHAMTGERLRPLRALRAFALAQAGGAREAGAAEPVLAALRPASYQELAYLGAKWPELDQFLRGNLAA